jgi:hypothetical protein
MASKTGYGSCRTSGSAKLTASVGVFWTFIYLQSIARIERSRPGLHLLVVLFSRRAGFWVKASVDRIRSLNI